jgi:hypothetical protein
LRRPDPGDVFITRRGGVGAGLALAGADAGFAAALAACAGAVLDAGADPGDTGRVTTKGFSLVGGTTRSTCPTSMMLGFSRLFQRTMSRQFWPFSRPMRIMVSPGLTV